MLTSYLYNFSHRRLSYKYDEWWLQSLSSSNLKYSSDFPVLLRFGEWQSSFYRGHGQPWPESPPLSLPLVHRIPVTTAAPTLEYRPISDWLQWPGHGQILGPSRTVGWRLPVSHQYHLEWPHDRARLPFPPQRSLQWPDLPMVDKDPSRNFSPRMNLNLGQKRQNWLCIRARSLKPSSTKVRNTVGGQSLDARVSQSTSAVVLAAGSFSLISMVSFHQPIFLFLVREKSSWLNLSALLFFLPYGIWIHQILSGLFSPACHACCGGTAGGLSVLSFFQCPPSGRQRRVFIEASTAFFIDFMIFIHFISNFQEVFDGGWSLSKTFLRMWTRASVFFQRGWQRPQISDANNLSLG